MLETRSRVMSYEWSMLIDRVFRPVRLSAHLGLRGVLRNKIGVKLDNSSTSLRDERGGPCFKIGGRLTRWPRSIGVLYCICNRQS